MNCMKSFQYELNSFNSIRCIYGNTYPKKLSSDLIGSNFPAKAAARMLNKGHTQKSHLLMKAVQCYITMQQRIKG